MEEGLFPNKDVAPLLKKNFVEARLHYDSQTIPKERMDRMLAVREKYVGHPAMPVYVIMDPDSGEALGKYEGSPRTVDKLLRFLEKGLGK